MSGAMRYVAIRVVGWRQSSIQPWKQEFLNPRHRKPESVLPIGLTFRTGTVQRLYPIPETSIAIVLSAFFNRRSFLTHATLAAGAGWMSQPGSLFAERLTRIASSPKSVLQAQDQVVLQFVTRIGRHPMFVGGGILGRLSGRNAGPMDLLLQVDDWEAMYLAGTAASTQPWNLHAAGNTLSMSVDGVVYQVECLTPEAYSQRISSFHLTRGSLFAHDAVHQDASQTQVQDPQSAGGGGFFQLRRTQAAIGLRQQVAQLVRGWVDAHRHGLVPDTEFKAFQRRTLTQTSVDDADIEPIAALILGAIGSLRTLLPNQLAEIALSPLAASTAGRWAGRTAADFERRWREMEIPAGLRGIPPAARWMDALAGPTWRKSGIRLEPATLDHAGQLQTRITWIEARRLAESDSITQTSEF